MQLIYLAQKTPLLFMSMFNHLTCLLMVNEGYEQILATSTVNLLFSSWTGHFFRVIDREEFKKVMSLMRSFNRQGSTHKDGLRIGLKVGQPVENGGVVEYFFGSDGNEPLHCVRFSNFLKELHDEVICFFHTLIQHDEMSTKIDPDLTWKENAFMLYSNTFFVP
jgi:hypothetical protein